MTPTTPRAWEEEIAYAQRTLHTKDYSQHGYDPRSFQQYISNLAAAAEQAGHKEYKRKLRRIASIA
ncbi:hypothetical protein [Thioalkalivibrio thiocyanodenitrificans]|uniref:hypothetical protein n=1 Tax=Thioalkalivibrio thiocyanodenitrificans TaxID=243063 RepID=UPI00036A4A2B|nr:hypothetical protein [Thioalkalivibrio thiocyanodenitrificans]